MEVLDASNPGQPQGADENQRRWIIGILKRRATFRIFEVGLSGPGARYSARARMADVTVHRLLIVRINEAEWLKPQLILDDFPIR